MKLMNSRRSLFSRTGILAALLLIVMAIGQGAAAQEKVLRVAVHADLRTLDQAQTTSFITQRYGYAVYDTLFAFNSKLEPQPQMVDTYKVSEDGKVYEFTLRDGLLFNDSEPVRSADCIASLARWMEYDPMGQSMKTFVDKMDVVNDKTFTLTLKRPWSMVLTALSKIGGAPFILPERIAKTPAGMPIMESIGSGPFIFKADEWIPGSKAVFVRNPNYKPRSEPADLLSGGKVVNIDRVEWHYFPDDNTALSAFRTGEIDYYEQPPPQFMQLLKDDPDVDIKVLEVYGQVFLLRPNHTQPPFNNVKARQALLHLVRQKEIMQAIIGDEDYYLDFCGAYFMCGSENETEAGSDVLKDYDVEKAKALLKEAGYNGEPIVFLATTDRQTHQTAAMIMQQELRDAGVNVQSLAGDYSTLTGVRDRKQGWNLFAVSSAANAAMPTTATWFNSRCDKAGPGWPCDEELMELVQAWSTAATKEEQREILDKLNRRAYETVPYIPLGQFFQPTAFHKNIKGVLKAGMPVYWNITIEDK
ncbi:ABC transporter substrate-binding protein [Pseudochelatococcus sp. B33]